MVIGEFDGDDVCIKCTTCSGELSVKVKNCTDYADTVCGESPEAEAMYAFGLAVYVCYVVGAMGIYQLHFVKKNNT